MQFQFDITTQQPKPAPPPGSPEAVTDLLRHQIDLQRDGFTQVLEVLRESLAFSKHAHQENLLRWRNILHRWDKDFPDLPADGKRAYPVLEKAYLNLVQNMLVDLVEMEEDGFDSDFALQDFLDRHGMRVGQLGHLLSIVGPISEIGNQAEKGAGGQQPS